VSRLSNRVWLAALVLLLISHSNSRAAAPAAESLLPDSTKGFLAIGSLEQLTESWNKTQLGKLTQDPAMKPFMEDLQRQIEQKWTQTHRKLGINWDDLNGVPSGEVAVAEVKRPGCGHCSACFTGDYPLALDVAAQLGDNEKLSFESMWGQGT